MSDVVIVGASETRRLGVIPDQSAMGLACEAALLALADAGLTLADVDGVASTQPIVDLAFTLGLRPRWIDGTVVGGTSNLVHIRHAMAAIESGRADVVLITHGESGRSGIGGAFYGREPHSLMGQFELPWGVLMPATRFTLPVMAYLHRYGLGEADLAEVPVAQSHWAARNPRAARQKILTVDDVLASPLIAWPFHRLETCLRSDGGGALVLTSAERAADMNLAARPVRIAGAGEACETPGTPFMEDLTSSRAFRDASAAAMAEAGMSHGDIDHLMIYDAFAHVPLYGLEDMGFVERGGAAEFIRGGATRPGGALPMNTNGGGLLYAHSGMYGMYALQEAVRQMQGRAAAQVDGARTSLVLGVGGMFAAAGAVVFQAG
ncbi:thiolase [Novosphingobium bradum]|uniref:Thiolase n=1 Tax=Novosphingobium bradum TaxID=1737444 RepID=A0ABV7IJI2_9SPHN